jgi:hydroxypyruvate reductase
MSLRSDALTIVRTALQAVDARTLVNQAVRKEGQRLAVDGGDLDLSGFRRLFVAGAGKASVAMAAMLEEILGDSIDTGLVITDHGSTAPLRKVKVLEAGHPLPDKDGLDATRELRTLLSAANEDDLVFFLLSGGASSLLASFRDGISLEDAREAFGLLLHAGLNIAQMNVIRKAMSLAHGGRAALWASPATTVTLALSDVPADDIQTIGSGPTVPDNTTPSLLQDALRGHGLRARLPASVLASLDGLTDGDFLRPSNPCFDRGRYVVVGNIQKAVMAAQRAALKLGYDTAIWPAWLSGDCTEAANEFLRFARTARSHTRFCALAGGETTVRVMGNGRGGRNQHFVLSVAPAISEEDEILVLSAGTDGRDGMTDAAGAILDAEVLRSANDRRLNPAVYLKDCNSYGFFEQTGGLIRLGPTQTNVMDLALILFSDTHG